jgi:predicted ATPase
MSQWRAALVEALGPNGHLIVNLVPELALIVGEQPEAPELPPQDQQARFQLVFRRFLGVFARPEHPLALFIDDLQWLDSATLDLIEHLILHPEVRHLLMIGAYRDIDVISVPRTHSRECWRGSVTPAEGYRRSCSRLSSRRMWSGCLPMRCTLSAGVQPLADLVFKKTAGNPFFTIQFISALAQEALLEFDPGIAAWTWNLPRIRIKGFTDNVADLMAIKLSHLPPTTQKVLGRLACLGNVADMATLTGSRCKRQSDTRGAMGSRPRRTCPPYGRHLRIRPRSYPGGGLCARRRGRARDGTSPDRSLACSAHRYSTARREHLRHREPI